MGGASLAQAHSQRVARPIASFALPALILITALVWGAVPWGTFQFDDFLNVVRDPATMDGAVLIDRLQHGLRPLTRLSYFVDARLFGMHAAGFLATNLVLHIATTALVYALARQRLEPLSAFLAALFFALQPANAEVVACVSGRSTGLMTALLLGGLLLHDRGRHVGACVLFVLACLAKETALIFPLLLLVWEGTRDRPRTLVLREATIALALAVTVFAALLTLDGYRSMLSYSLAFRSVGENLLANARAVPTMLSLWFRPWDLSADHDFDPSGAVATSIAGLALLAAAAVAAIALRRRHALLALAVLWPLIALLPTNSIVAKIDLVTEKPLYLAWAGPAIALGAAAGFGMATARRRVLAAALVATLLCVLAGATWLRASLWRDPVALWADAVVKAPDKSRCWNNLGMAYLVAERNVEAVHAFEQAVDLEPRNEAARLNLQAASALCGARCARN